jgi:hypothetical protein
MRLSVTTFPLRSNYLAMSRPELPVKGPKLVEQSFVAKDVAEKISIRPKILKDEVGQAVLLRL